MEGGGFSPGDALSCASNDAKFLDIGEVRAVVVGAGRWFEYKRRKNRSKTTYLFRFLSQTWSTVLGLDLSKRSTDLSLCFKSGLVVVASSVPVRKHSLVRCCKRGVTIVLHIREEYKFACPDLNGNLHAVDKT